MKKRLRKKLRLGEFQQTGFPVCLFLSFAEGAPEEDAFWDKLVEAIEARGLLMLGLMNDFFVFTDYRIPPQPSAMEVHRQLISDWLSQQPEVTAFEIGPLSNVWLPFFKY